MVVEQRSGRGSMSQVEETGLVEVTAPAAPPLQLLTIKPMLNFTDKEQKEESLTLLFITNKEA
ncbi:hypothetical protein EYF80_041386 [Liparis tanakae]|uniref:Uncharacterized protein n=1 Tax=Liparis tanakae TaxID=230148 RepID=A0A4Z2G5J3_9TELE|nr:hypothetical protein EYF80_041386 [Liparis tanakae]